MKYVGFFNSERNSHEKRINHMSANNKMLYVSKTIEEVVGTVSIISPSWTTNKKIYRSSKETLNNNISLILGPTIPYIKGVTHLWSMLWLTLYLIKNTKKYETLVVYHSLILMLPILVLKYFRKVKIILEVEEIYSLVIEDKRRFLKKEINFIKKMDTRILVSKKLQEYLGTSRDIILYGSYVDKKDSSIKKKKKSLVYAGSIDKLKGGVFSAIEMMEKLEDKEAILYILGTGAKEDIIEMRELIESVNNLKNYEAIKFLGKKSGKEFEITMNQFEYALNLQNIGDYMNTAFPSKILTYLSFGQKIISTKIKSIYESPFSKYICFVDDNPITWADKVNKVINSEATFIDTENVIINYHQSFRSNIEKHL